MNETGSPERRGQNDGKIATGAQGNAAVLGTLHILRQLNRCAEVSA